MDKYHDDVEVSQDVTPDTVWDDDRGVRDDRGTKALGIISIILSILGFFYYGYLLASAGIILGVLGVKRGSSLGWWAIVLGVIAIIVNLTFGLVLLPTRLFH